MTRIQEALIQLVRLGIGTGTVSGFKFQDPIGWSAVKTLAEEQGLSAVVLDGIEKLPNQQRPPKVDLLQWIGETLQGGAQYADQQKAATEMALLFHKNHIRTYVLKGLVIAECYPKPNRRLSVDMDCYLMKEFDSLSSSKLQGDDWDAWSLGNDLIKNQGYEVAFDYYKNSTFYLSGLTVENHQYMVPFRGNRTLKNLEIVLHGLMRNDVGSDIIEGTCLCRPPIMVSAIFLIEHAYSHFLHQGLTWRMVLDWMMFSKKHKKEIDWYSLNAMIDEFGFRKFYDTYYKLGKYLLGEMTEEDLTTVDKRMLADIWAPLDLHDNIAGVKGKINMAGNYWRARWKFRNFSNISWLHALWIQVWGHLFIKNPRL